MGEVAGMAAMASGLAGAASAPAPAPALVPPPSSLPLPVWRPDHIVVVVLENLSAHEATDSQRSAGMAPVYDRRSDWQWFNEQAARGVRFTQSHFGRTPYGSELPCRPSQPNYLMLFSGHHQGVLPAWFEDTRSPYPGQAVFDRDGRPLPAPRKGPVGVANANVPDDWLPFTSPNMGAALLQSGKRFLSFSESLPHPSWRCATDSGLVPCQSAWAPTDDYRRKHNPAVNWTDQAAPTSRRGLQGDLARHVLPLGVNLGFEATEDPVLRKRFRGFAQDEQGRPLGFEHLPDVSLVIPNEQHDAHSNTAKVADQWLRSRIGAYADWAMTHNSLLILTFDEDGSTDARRGNAYQQGAHPIPTVFVGQGVRPGVCERPIDHLNVLATVLWLNGALARFRDDFRQFHGVVDGSGSQAEREWRNLQPVTEVFRPLS